MSYISNNASEPNWFTQVTMLPILRTKGSGVRIAPGASEELNLGTGKSLFFWINVWVHRCALARPLKRLVIGFPNHLVFQSSRRRGHPRRPLTAPDVRITYPALPVSVKPRQFSAFELVSCIVSPVDQ